jgi:hypothetical protein
LRPLLDDVLDASSAGVQAHILPAILHVICAAFCTLKTARHTPTPTTPSWTPGTVA